MYIGSNLWNHIGGLVHVAWRRFLIESLNIWFNKCIAAIYLVTKRFSRLDKDCYVLITNIMSKCIYFYLRLLISFAWSLVNKKKKKVKRLIDGKASLHSLSASSIKSIINSLQKTTALGVWWLLRGAENICSN